MTEWIIPCNPMYYNISEAFENLKSINWRHSNPNFNIGDIVYIYIGKPIMAIKYKCIISKVNLPDIEINDSKYNKTNVKFSKYMELSLLKPYGDQELTLQILNTNGVSGYIQGPRRVNEKLKSYMNNKNL